MLLATTNNMTHITSMVSHTNFSHLHCRDNMTHPFQVLRSLLCSYIRVTCHHNIKPLKPLKDTDTGHNISVLDLCMTHTVLSLYTHVNMTHTSTLLSQMLYDS